MLVNEGLYNNNKSDIIRAFLLGVSAGKTLLEGNMVNINDVCDYIIVKLAEAGDTPSVLKIQKLLYYVQSWHLAINKTALFNGKFQAWIHGPVNREIYNRFVNNKFMYSSVGISDLLGGQDNLSKEDKLSIDDVLDVYAKFTGSQLEEMTHKEDPWLNARGSLSPSERCETEINEEEMQRFYASRL